jgi:hypothetical protein
MVISREGVTARVKRSVSLEVAQSAVCAVLYAMGSYLTAYISSPWGSGQFRPAVVIPAIFATLFGPFVGGIGAALGTLVADSIKHGELYVRSLVSAVPGNLIGFYLFGWLMKRRFNWENFVKTSQVTLLVSNLIVAFLYVYYRVFVDASYPVAFADSWIYVSLGLVAWWYVTMLPFVLLLGPPLIRAVASAFPGFVSEQVRSLNVRSEVLTRSFSMALILPGVMMLLIGIMTVLADPNQLLSLNIVANPLILAGMQAMFIVGGAILLTLGILILATGKFIISGK